MSIAFRKLATLVGPNALPVFAMDRPSLIRLELANGNEVVFPFADEGMFQIEPELIPEGGYPVEIWTTDVEQEAFQRAQWPSMLQRLRQAWTAIRERYADHDRDQLLDSFEKWLAEGLAKELQASPQHIKDEAGFMARFPFAVSYSIRQFRRIAQREECEKEQP